jgi:hypothetical protein
MITKHILTWDCAGPQETATISWAIFFSFSRTASSTAISSNGFMECLTPSVTTPVLSGFTRIWMKSTVFQLCNTRFFSITYHQKNCWSPYNHAQGYKHPIQVLSWKLIRTKGCHLTCWITSYSGKYCTIQGNGLWERKIDSTNSGYSAPLHPIWVENFFTSLAKIFQQIADWTLDITSQYNN